MNFGEDVDHTNVSPVSWVWCQRPGADTIPRRLEPLLKLYTCLWRWAERKAETCKAEVNGQINLKTVRIMLVIIQFHSKMHGPYNIKFRVLSVLVHHAHPVPWSVRVYLRCAGKIEVPLNKVPASCSGLQFKCLWVAGLIWTFNCQVLVALVIDHM
jgi:hypothetical protein